MDKNWSQFCSCYVKHHIGGGEAILPAEHGANSSVMPHNHQQCANFFSAASQIRLSDPASFQPTVFDSAGRPCGPMCCLSQPQTWKNKSSMGTVNSVKCCVRGSGCLLPCHLCFDVVIYCKSGAQTQRWALDHRKRPVAAVGGNLFQSPSGFILLPEPTDT